MTDNDIIKALECCFVAESCSECPWFEKCRADTLESLPYGLGQAALDLINRQKAEIEDLQSKCDSLRSAANSLKMHYNNVAAEIERLNNHILDVTKKVKAEAIKEFLQKIESEKWNYGEEEAPIWVVELIDLKRIAKEMTGEIEMFFLDELEDALRLEAEPEDIKTTEEGIALVKWLKKCRRILRRIQRLEKKLTEDQNDV